MSASPTGGLLANGLDSATLTVTLRDSFGNPLTGHSVTLQSSTGQITGPSQPTNAQGQTTATLTSTVAGPSVVSLATPTGLSNLQATVTFNAGTPDAAQSSFNLSTQSSVTANGTSSVSLVVVLRDAQGNPVPGETVQFSSTGSGNTLNQPSSVTDASGQAIGTLQSTVAEIKTLTLSTPAGFGIPALTKTVTFVPGPPSASQSTLTANPSTGLTADGSSAATLTLTVKDAKGNPISGIAAVFNTSGGDLTQPSRTTNALGQTTGSLTSTSIGSKQVSVMSPALLTSLQTSITFGSGLIDPAHSTLSVSSPSGTVADGIATVTLTATLKDSNQNPVSGQSVQFAASGTSNTLTQPTALTNAQGQATATLATTRAEAKVITLSAPAGLGALSQNVSFSAGPAVLAKSTLTAAPASGIVADGADETIVSVLLRDQFENPVPAQTLGIQITGGTGNTHSTPATTNASGTTFFSVSSTSTGSKTIELTAPAGVVGLSAAVSFSAPLACVGGTPTTLTSPTTATVLSTSQHLVLSGTCATDSVLSLGGDILSGDVISPSGSLTQTCDATGNFQFEITKTSDGTFSIQLQSACGTTANGSQTVLWNRDTSAPGAPVITSPASEPFTSHSSPLVFGGTCVAGATIELSGLSNAQGTCNSQGRFQFMVSAPSDGTYSLLVRQRDPAGNASTWASRTWVLDSTAPATPTLITPALTPFSSADSSLSLVIGCEAGATVGLSGDASRTATCAANNQVSFSLSQTFDGQYHYEVVQNDAAGNSSEVLVFDWNRDTTMPTSPVITSPALNPVYTGTLPLAIAGTCTPGDTVFLSGPVTLAEIQSPAGSDSVPCSAGGTFAFTLQKAADGAFTLNFTQEDRAGNASAAASLTWIRDTAAPAAPVLTQPASSPHVAPSNLSLQGTCEPGALVLLGGDLGASQTTCTAQGGFTFSQNIAADGIYSLNLRQQDPAGNQSTSISQTWERSSTAPAPTTITVPLAATTLNNQSTLTIQGTCTPERTVALSGIPASSVTSPANSLTLTCPSQGTFSYRLSRPAEGTDTLSITQSAAGFTSSPVTRTWTRDFTAPNTTISPAPLAKYLTNSVSIPFSTSEAGSTFQCTVDGITTSCTSPLNLTNLTNGSHSLSIVATDGAGNSDASPATASFIVESYSTIALYHFAGTNPLGDSTLYTAPENNPLTTVTNGGGGTASPGKFNGSWRISNATATLDFLQAPDNQTQRLGNSVMTVELWTKLTAGITTSGRYYVLASKMGASGQYGWEIRLVKNSTGYQVTFVVATTSGTSTTSRSMTSNCMTLANATSSWNHLAVTWNQGRVAFYCNGVARGTGTVGTAGTTTLFPSNAPLRIGESGFASSSKMPIKAEIDEFRMSKTVRYPAAFTVPSSEFTPD